jgi:TonB family protein
LSLPPTERPSRAEHFGAHQVAGLLATAAVHLVLIGALVLGNRGEAKPRPKPRGERIIETRIIEIQAGSQEGTRTEGPAYKRRRARRAPPRARRRPRRVAVGSKRPRRARRARRASRGPTLPTNGKDDAVDVPDDWGSTEGVDAPPGAGPADDKHGAGGTADKGALDPCFTQHEQVVASYRAKVAKKIPPMKRPAFVSAAVAKNLDTVVRVALDASGKIVRVTVARPSGNPRFDEAAKAHVQAVGSLPAPHKCVMYDKVKGRFRNSVTFAVTVRAR